MKQIPLWRKNGTVRAFALVDDSDYRELSQYRWHVNPVSHSPEAQGYAVRWGEGRSLIKMSRQILGLEVGDRLQADHINGDTLDNRRSNLRAVTHAQNMQNRGSHKGSSSRFRSVYWDTSRGRWRVRVRLNKVSHGLGTFRDEIEAGMVAEAWRKEHMPFAQPDPELANVADEYPETVPPRFFSAVVATVEQDLGAALFDIDLPGLDEFGRLAA